MKLFQQYDTPLYLFDSGVLRERISYLRSRLPRGMALCYAVKANPFLVREAEPFVDRFEVCSPGEAEICFSCGVPEEKMVISGVYKPRDYVDALVGGHPRIGAYTVESLEQYALLKEASARYRRPLELLLRLTSGNQFGINPADMEEILADEHPYLHIRGIQFFSGTQKTSLKKLRRELTHLDELLTRLKDSRGFCAEELELGPGFPVSYFRGEEFDEEGYLSEFSALLGEMENRPRLALELGRSIAASCGTYYTRVVDTKRNKGENYAIVDGGIHHLVYYSQMMAMKTPLCVLLPEERTGPEENWNICGSLCTSNDILLKQFPARDLKVGDIFAFENTGAYCMTESMSLFLSHPLPGVVLKDRSGEYHLLRAPLETSGLNTPQYK